jgi:hypothetical protein
MILLVTLLACWTPTETGPTGMVGRVLSPEGEPLAGLPVSTVEANAVTDAEGRFAVSYKEPSRWATATWRGLAWRRTYDPADDGAIVDLQLVPTHPVVVDCDVIPACDALLAWEVSERLVAELRVRCDREVPAQVEGVPFGTPTRAACQPSADQPGGPLRVVVDGDRLGITPPAVVLGVELVTEQLPIPEACEVRVGDTAARPIGPGRFEADVFGEVSVTGTCDGVPFTPRRVYVRDPATVEIVWRRDVPTVDLSAAPWADVVLLHKVGGRERGWTLRLRRDDAGRHVLPPLDEGTYAIGLSVETERLGALRPADDLPEDVLTVVALPREVWRGDQPEGAGVVRVTSPRTSGPLPVRWAEPGDGPTTAVPDTP